MLARRSCHSVTADDATSFARELTDCLEAISVKISEFSFDELDKLVNSSSWQRSQSSGLGSDDPIVRLGRDRGCSSNKPPHQPQVSPSLPKRRAVPVTQAPYKTEPKNCEQSFVAEETDSSAAVRQPDEPASTSNGDCTTAFSVSSSPPLHVMPTTINKLKEYTTKRVGRVRARRRAIQQDIDWKTRRWTGKIKKVWKR